MIIELMDAALYDENTILATVNKTDDDGAVVRMAHLIPRDAVEWRAAEYGIDPGDTDTLLDIILHEPHVQVDQALGLYQAPNVDAAREHLLAKVREHKAESAHEQGLRRVLPGKGKVPDPRGKLLDLLHVDREAIELKAQMVGLQMARVQEQARQSRPAPEDRISRLRDTLKEMKNGRHDDNPSAADQA